MGKRRALFWFIYPLCLLIILACLFTAFWAARQQCKTQYMNDAKVEAEALALELAGFWETGPNGAHSGDINKFVEALERIIPYSITVMDQEGALLADSKTKLPNSASQLKREPEIEAALAGRTTISERLDFSTKQYNIYAAAPVKVDDGVVAAVRTSLPESRIKKRLLGLKRRMILAALIMALVFAGGSLMVTGYVTDPLDDMTTGARQFASGDLLYRVDGGSVAETLALATAMNRMAENLHEKIADITHQRNELEAVLTGMVEAVLVMDGGQFIKKMNRAAGDLFGVNPEAAEGKTIIEAIRNSDLQRFVQKTMLSRAPVEEELRIIGDTDLSIQAHGAPLKSHDGNFEGIVVVLNDITNIKKLETIRQDFVANVSHELKTPVTSIKGFLETLRDGALDDPDDARRFLDIMVKQTDRLSMIIEDLMSLSRIEQDEKKGAIGLEPHRVKPVVDSVMRNCEQLVKRKGMEIILNIEDDNIRAPINPTLLEQALANLVDNAIKYSEAEKKIWISLARSGGEIALSVQDQGCGISKEHVSRIFERFYRVDKARSRKVGGTGLGLAIVKHIVRAHRGRLEVQSALGEGATFSIYLPKV